MSDTPETDGEIKSMSGILEGFPDLAKLARRLERERDEAESKRKEIYGQLHRVCLEAFDMDDTIGGEPFDDYLLRKISDLKAINAELSSEWEAVHSGGEWWIADAKSGDLIVLISGPEKEIAEEIADEHNRAITKAKEAK